MRISLPAKNRPQRAFTMIEIAIAVGVIGFALVAIIGILPAGLTSQKDNREYTTISQDAPYFLNAIRNGEMRTNNSVLTNFVETITVSSTNGGYTNVYYNPTLGVTGEYPTLTNDMNVIGVLSTPEYDHRALNSLGAPITNQVIAVIRAMSGSALEQGGANSLMAYRYQLTVQNVPWDIVAPDSTNLNGYAPGTVEWLTRSNRWIEANYLSSSMHDVRLSFAWPVLPNGSLGKGKQTYRTVITSHLTNDTVLGGPPYNLWFFQPQIYMNNTNQ